MDIGSWSELWSQELQLGADYSQVFRRRGSAVGIPVTLAVRRTSGHETENVIYKYILWDVRVINTPGVQTWVEHGNWEIERAVVAGIR